ncbi:MAG: DUF2975 domain-containing protein [Mongoliibacter sp.]|uniref:DUF2975 domain-containing protein n=1 Tax=Mongoliibacter sp. TaxID=2022438 RepID=UPI0012F14B33|nr:DUF2975 domain-containing protein [Mongoliibacter sp.]TVP46591.1 MAG: DUF2975 domain-containing protein [Mongoliibacter sp.]
MNWKESWKNKWESQPMLMLITIVIWSIFIGLCIKGGAMLFTFTFSLFKPEVAKDLYEGLNLHGLLTQHFWNYMGVMSFILVVAGQKAYMFYLMIRVFLAIDLIHPFSKEVSKLITEIGQMAIQIGVIIIIASAYFAWLTKRGFDIPTLGGYLGGAFEYLLMGALIYAIAQVFKRGVAIQSENELTI